MAPRQKRIPDATYTISQQIGTQQQMIGQLHFYSNILLAATLISGGIAIYAWRHRQMPGAKEFTGLMIAIALWTTGDALAILSIDINSKLLLKKIAHIGIVTAPIFWLLFTIQFTNNAKWLTPRRLTALFGVASIGLFAVWSTELHPWYYQDYGLDRIDSVAIFSGKPGIMYWVNALYSYLLMVGSLLLLIHMFRRTEHPYRNQIGLMLPGAVFPLIGNLLYHFGLSRQFSVNLTPFFFTITGIIIAWGLFRSHFLRITPVARDRVIENLNAGMLVLDYQDKVIDINPVMARFVEFPGTQAIGHPAKLVLRSRVNLGDDFWNATEALVELAIERNGIQHDYELHLSPVTDPQGQVMGRLIVLHDVSRITQTTRELEKYVDQNTRLLAQELRQRSIAESLRQTMISISSSLDLDALLDEILAQLKEVLPYYSAAIYLSEGKVLNLTRIVGPEAISADTYSTPRRLDQITKVYKTQKAEAFSSAYSTKEKTNGIPKEPIYSTMAAPLLTGSEALGVLTIDRFEPKPFTQDNAETLQAYSNQVAITIKNAELYQQAQTAAVIQERNRLAQELHDAVNQTLFTASIIAEALPQVWEKDPEQGQIGLNEIQHLTRGALAEMRALLMELRPQSITEKTLGDLLDQLTRAVSSRARIPVEFSVENDTIMPVEIQVNFYRIAQETLNNIVKHAKATQVQVFLDARPDRVVMEIEDDGQGFEIDEILFGHMGLEIMRERAEKIGADLMIISQPSKGTKIEAVWPIQKSKP